MDYKILAIGAVIGAVISLLAGGVSSGRSDTDVLLLKNQIHELERKLDALMKHLGVQPPPPPPSGMSPELERLSSFPDTKIAAIKLYREEHPGTGLREAKEKVEAFYKSRRG